MSVPACAAIRWRRCVVKVNAGTGSAVRGPTSPGLTQQQQSTCLRIETDFCHPQWALAPRMYVGLRYVLHSVDTDKRRRVAHSFNECQAKFICVQMSVRNLRHVLRRTHMIAQAL